MRGRAEDPPGQHCCARIGRQLSGRPPLPAVFRGRGSRCTGRSSGRGQGEAFFWACKGFCTANALPGFASKLRSGCFLLQAERRPRSGHCNAAHGHRSALALSLRQVPIGCGLLRADPNPWAAESQSRSRDSLFGGKKRDLRFFASGQSGSPPYPSCPPPPKIHDLPGSR